MSKGSDRGGETAKRFERGFWLIFGGMVAAAWAPGFGVGLSALFALLGSAAVAWGIFVMARVMRSRAQRGVMQGAGVLAAVYAAGLAGELAWGDSGAWAGAWVGQALCLCGALGLLGLGTGFEYYCRERGWVRLARWWLAVQALVGVLYVAPVLVGMMRPFYVGTFAEFPELGRVYGFLGGFEFHGMRLSGARGWWILAWAAYVLPAGLLLVNLLRTWVESRRPRGKVEEGGQVEWSRR